MKIIDSHAHFDEFVTEGVLPDLMKRSADAGVFFTMAIGGHPDANALAVRLAHEHAGLIGAAVGYDRDGAGKGWELSSVREQARLAGVLAIGETGLDYHYAPETASIQRTLFESMLQVAAEVSKPVVVHSREADEDTLDMLRAHSTAWKAEPARMGVLHCYTGDKSFARKLLDMGLRISFSGIVTFRNAEALREVAAYIPEEALLIETDAPFLAPVPCRGKRNEPALVCHVAEMLATVRKVPVEHIAEVTTRNAITLFGITSGEQR